jgi:hypothetical protein
MSRLNSPGFGAEACLYKSTRSYRSRMTQPMGGGHTVVTHGPAARGTGQVVPAFKVIGRCEKDEEGNWECEWDSVVV